MTDEEINACRESSSDADCGRCPVRARCIEIGLEEWHQHHGGEWQRELGTEPPEEVAE